jgi:nucleotide-binding universal stress UspA family protein
MRSCLTVCLTMSLTVLCAIADDEGAAATASLQETRAQQGREVGAALVEAADLWDDPTIIATGDPATELERIGQEHDAALVVAGTHGRGLVSGTLHGSVSRSLARSGSRPVVLVRRGVVPCLGGPVVCGVDPGGGPPRPNRSACRAPGRLHRPAARARARAAHGVRPCRAWPAAGTDAAPCRRTCCAPPGGRSWSSLPARMTSAMPPDGRPDASVRPSLRGGRMLWILLSALVAAVVVAATALESPSWMVVLVAMLIAVLMLAMRRLRAR